MQNGSPNSQDTRFQAPNVADFPKLAALRTHDADLGAQNGAQANGLHPALSLPLPSSYDAARLTDSVSQSRRGSLVRPLPGNLLVQVFYKDHKIFSLLFVPLKHSLPQLMLQFMHLCI